jgi:hypothetical protein
MTTIRTLFGILLLAMAAIQAVHGQKVSVVLGNLCSNVDNASIYDQGHPYGRMGLIVRNKPMFMRVIVYGIPMKLTFYRRRAWPKTDRIGTQYWVRYEVVNGEKQAMSISATGRHKLVQPCSE